MNKTIIFFFFCSFLLFLILGINFSGVLDKDSTYKPVNCLKYKSPNIDRTKPLTESIGDFEESPYFRGYKLKNYLECYKR